MNMRPASPVLLAPIVLLLACAPGLTSTPGGIPREPRPPAAATSPSEPAPALREANPDDPLCAPLLIEQTFEFGTHVVMRRLPTAADLEELRFISGLRQVLLALPSWPSTYAELQPLQRAILPDGAEVVVLLPGWPPTHEALGAWNLVGGNLRLIMVVDGPPADRGLITELNHVRALERVIAQMEHPSRSGFERLQRPLSFRVLRP